MEFLSHSLPNMSKLRPIIPALIAGAVLAVLVTTARCSQSAMHEAEIAEMDPAVDNSMPTGRIEGQRIEQRFPESVILPDSTLRYIVLEPGEGEKPKTGSYVLVHYTGTLWDGTKFDSSVDRGDPLRFRLGVGQVIKGWDQGIADMKPGEKRLLIIPYYLAYGDRGRRPTIPQRATLLFEVELVGVE